ncbi:MAG TPA: chemotaxis protein CheW [Bacteroidetes bacterium]|nr:chemotaxis protein CheW [Bacteroidota bacterium]
MTEKKNVGSRTQSDEVLQLVSFTIGQEEFGVDILKVQEINRMVDITRVPNAPAFVSGVINLRGKVIPIVDLRQRFGLSRKDNDKNTRIIVVELSARVIGFVVDAVKEVLRIPRSVTEPPPPMVAGIGSEYITAVGKLEDRLLILLDLERVLSGEEHAQIAA